MDFEVRPSARESASAVVVGGVGGGVFVLVFNEVEVPSYDEVGGGGDGFLEGRELGSPSCEARGVQVKV